MLYRKRDEEQEETIPPHPCVSRGGCLGLGVVVGVEKETVSRRLAAKLY